MWKNYISKETYDYYVEKRREEKRNLGNLLSSQTEHKKGLFNKNFVEETSIEIQSSLLKQIDDILKNSVLISRENLDSLRKENGIWVSYKLADENGNILDYVVWWVYTLKDNSISYKSPLALELFKIYTEELDYEESDFEEWELEINLNWKKYSILSVKNTNEIY